MLLSPSLPLAGASWCEHNGIMSFLQSRSPPPKGLYGGYLLILTYVFMISEYRKKLRRCVGITGLMTKMTSRDQNVTSDMTNDRLFTQRMTMPILSLMICDRK